jgi:hypothetical protein
VDRRAQDSVPRGGGIYGSNIDVVKKEGVYKAHTLGFASGRIWAGLGRSQPVSGKPSVCEGGNAVRVPPRARVFPVQGLVGR